jgi:hypothetical protein
MEGGSISPGTGWAPPLDLRHGDCENVRVQKEAPGPRPPITAELKLARKAAEFIVLTDDALYQERVVKMGWHRIGEGSFARRVAANDDLARIFENFSRHVVEMVEQSARQRPVQWDVALEEFVDRAEGTGLRWWLYGSGALAVRGIDIDPGDLDLAVDDPLLAGEVSTDLLVEPVTRAENWVAEWTGRAFHGALIEWLSDAHPTGSSPPHEQEPAAAAYLERIVWRGRTVTVPRLELQLAVAEIRGLHERSALIREALKG